MRTCAKCTGKEERKGCICGVKEEVSINLPKNREFDKITKLVNVYGKKEWNGTGRDGMAHKYNFEEGIIKHA